MAFLDRKPFRQRIFVRILFLVSLGTSLPVSADSSSPRLAAYYDRFLAICGDHAYEWKGSEKPVRRLADIKQVGVGRSISYALTVKGELLAWRGNAQDAVVVIDGASSFFAGQSGVFVVRDDHSLWHIASQALFAKHKAKATRIASDVLTASVGDSANYYVRHDGGLYVHGLAHRGQYGNGNLAPTGRYIQTASNVVQVSSHTGHALIRKTDGTVWGTGGNIYGPLGRHGIGDKAIEWGLIIDDAMAIATGSTHSLAIKSDRTLWTWGRHDGLDPKPIMAGVIAAAASSRHSIALAQGRLWQWRAGIKPQPLMACVTS